jgi:hypothetical protein
MIPTQAIGWIVAFPARLEKQVEMRLSELNAQVTDRATKVDEERKGPVEGLEQPNREGSLASHAPTDG